MDKIIKPNLTGTYLKRYVSPFVEGLRPFQISVYSCVHLSLITGSDFFKLSPLHAFGMPPFIFRQMLLDHRNDELLTTTYILS
jgi:hypothetical protein